VRDPADDIAFRSTNNGTSYGASTDSTGDVVANTTWYHTAWCRSGDSLYAWLGGVQVGTTQTLTGSIQDTSDNITIGASNSTTNKYGGRTAGIRVTKAARYTASFTPPTLPYPTS
ncbi:MAG: hypothetical protein H0V63_08415, partial [Burkholderiaceae bacterium]|nr:hypothetical protein [Burkholderiaceae bacterium]